MITLELDYIPVPQKRHRHSRGRTYDPSAKDKVSFRLLARNALLDQEEDPLTWYACAVDFTFIFSKPKSWSKKKKENCHPCLKRVDVDNLAKFACDACNGLLWEDDSQIVGLTTKKVYGEEPKVIMQLHEIPIGTNILNVQL